MNTTTALLVVANLFGSIVIILLSIILWFGRSRFDTLDTRMVAIDIKVATTTKEHNDCRAGLSDRFAKREDVRALWKATNDNSEKIARMQGSCRVGAE